jgi:hypothetical protein
MILRFRLTRRIAAYTVQSVDTHGHREFRPFIPECTKVGIGRSKAYELANAGLLETISIGRRRFVYLDSLYSLPTRLQSGAGTSP